MPKIVRYNLEELKASKADKSSVNIPILISADLGDIYNSRLRIGIKGYNRKEQLIDATALFVETNRIIETYGRTDIVSFTRIATDLMADLIDAYSKEKGIEDPDRVKWDDVVKWVKKAVKTAEKSE